MQMEVQQYAQQGNFFAPCKVCGPDDRTALSKAASNADEVKGINVNVTEVRAFVAWQRRPLPVLYQDWLIVQGCRHTPELLLI